MQIDEDTAIDRIVLLSMDSLHSSIALPILIEHWQERVVGIGLSRRFGGAYGSLWDQLKRYLTRSGPAFVVYAGLQLILFYPMAFVAAGINRTLGRPQTVYPLRQLARRHRIPVFSTREPNSKSFVNRVRALKPDLIVVCYFDRIIGSELIAVPSRGVINIHTGLLPTMRGPVPNVWALIEGQRTAGATVHTIDDQTIDTGAILKDREVDVVRSESALALDCRLMRIGAKLATEVVAEMARGNAQPRAQDAGEGRYLSFPTRSDIRRLRQKGGRLYCLRDFVRPFFARSD